MSVKKIMSILLLLCACVFALYYLQPLKNGKGLDTETKYVLVKNWPQLPSSIKLGNPTGIGIDTNQNIVIFHRAGREWPLLASMHTDKIHNKTILIIDKKSGKLISSWGEDLFIMPHGLTVDKQNNIWVTDVALHQVFKFSHEGKLLLTIGEATIKGADESHFNKPTDVAVTADGSFYVSDGYGNSRIMKFSSSGKYLFEWGKKGNKAGEFNIPHAVSIGEQGNVYVADRENNRVQVFDSSGKFIRQWSDDSFGNICSLTFNNEQSKLFAVDDLSFFKLKHRGSDVIIFDQQGKVQTRFGRSGNVTGGVSWYHDVVVDADENIYAGDISGNTIQKFSKGINP